MLVNTHFQESDPKWPLKIMTDWQVFIWYTKFTRGLEMRLRNQNSYTVQVKYKKRQLIKHIQLFFADVDIKGWLKIWCKQ